MILTKQDRKMTTIQEPSKPIEKGRKKLVIILLITIIAAAVIYLTPGILVQNQKTTPQSWVKIGAYSTYEGNSTILSYSIMFSARMEIVDLNETHAKIQTKVNMSSPFGSNENTTTQWVERSNMAFQPEGLNLTSTRTQQISIPHMGTRTCTVYEYQNQDITATYYVDKQLQWPLKMTMSSQAYGGQTYSMDINLIESNIPGLS
jgi:hypothetical protein